MQNGLYSQSGRELSQRSYRRRKTIRRCLPSELSGLNHTHRPLLLLVLLRGDPHVAPFSHASFEQFSFASVCLLPFQRHYQARRRIIAVGPSLFERSEFSCDSLRCPQATIGFVLSPCLLGKIGVLPPSLGFRAAGYQNENTATCGDFSHHRRHSFVIRHFSENLQIDYDITQLHQTQWS